MAGSTYLEKVEQAYADLPEDLAYALEAANINESLYELMQKYGLTVDAASNLEVIVRNTVLGFTPIERFTTEIQKELSLPKETIEKLVRDINEMIFGEIRHQVQVYRTQQQNRPEILDELDAKERILGEREATPTPTPENEESLEDTAILKESGIEIVDEENRDEDSLVDTETTSDISEGDRGNLMSDIEAPKPSTSSPLYAQKTERPVSLPRAEHTIDTTAPTSSPRPTRAQSAMDALTTKSQSQESAQKQAGYSGKDPYREPIE